MDNYKIKLFEKCRQYHLEWQEECRLIGESGTSALIRGAQFTVLFELITENGLNDEYADYEKSVEGGAEI